MALSFRGAFLRIIKAFFLINLSLRILANYFYHEKKKPRGDIPQNLKTFVTLELGFSTGREKKSRVRTLKTERNLWPRATFFVLCNGSYRCLACLAIKTRLVGAELKMSYERLYEFGPILGFILKGQRF